MSEKTAVWIQCHKSIVGKLYAEVVRYEGVIQRQTQSGDLYSVLVRAPLSTMAALQQAVSRIRDDVVITPA